MELCLIACHPPSPQKHESETLLLDKRPLPFFSSSVYKKGYRILWWPLLHKLTDQTDPGLHTSCAKLRERQLCSRMRMAAWLHGTLTANNTYSSPFCRCCLAFSGVGTGRLTQDLLDTHNPLNVENQIRLQSAKPGNSFWTSN